MLEPIALARVWPPNMAAEEIKMALFFDKNSCTVIHSRVAHS